MARLALALALLLCPTLALANDAEMSGRGANLLPVQDSALHMQREDIELQLRGSRFVVRARYWFENPTDAPVSATLGFPELACDEEDDCPPPDFENMRTFVRGRAVPHREGRLAPEHPWSAHLGRVWLFDLTVRPGETVQVEHRYALAPGGSITGAQWIDYVTRTGAAWPRPIGHARFTFVLPASALLLHVTPELPVVRSDRRGDTRRLVLERHDWRPEGDLRLHYAREDHALPWSDGDEEFGGFDWSQARSRVPALGQCRALGELPAAALRPREARAAFAETLAASDADLRTCRNAVFARHGLVFRDAALNLYFYGTDAPTLGADAGFAWRPTQRGTVPLFAHDRIRLDVIERATKLRAARTAAAAQGR